MSGVIKLIRVSRQNGYTLTQNHAMCSLKYYSIEQRRQVIKTWQEQYGDIVIQISPDLKNNK